MGPEEAIDWKIGTKLLNYDNRRNQPKSLSNSKCSLTIEERKFA